MLTGTTVVVIAAGFIPVVIDVVAVAIVVGLLPQCCHCDHDDSCCVCVCKAIVKVEV